MALRSDVLPLPDGPMITLITPAWNIVVTGLTIVSLGSLVPRILRLSRASPNLSSPRSMDRTSAAGLAFISSLPADKSGSEGRDLPIVISFFLKMRSTTEVTKKKPTKPTMASMGLASQFVGKPSEAMTNSPVNGAH